MNYLVFAIVCSVIVSVFLKVARRNHIDIAQAIASNYIMATALTWFVLKPDLSSIQNSNPQAIGLFVALGFLLPSVFIIMSKAVESAGIVKSDAAQRLSLFIPIVWALLFFGEKLTPARALGIILAFAALSCLLYKGTGKSSRGSGGSFKQTALPLLGVWLGYGVIDILFKQIAKTGSAFAGNLFVAFVLAGLLIFIYLIIKHTKWSAKSLLAGLVLGTLNFGNILFYVRAHQVFKNDPTLVFAGMNIGVITLGTLVGALLFREKISRINALGIVLAILSIFCLFYLSKVFPQLA